jgi:hypothetical protein
MANQILIMFTFLTIRKNNKHQTNKTSCSHGSGMKMRAFWDIVLCSLIQVDPMFQQCLLRIAIITLMMMEAVSTSEMSSQLL